jgi:20S proteasome subunit alpha 5
MWNDSNKYDRGVNTFSPEGRIFQIEYAFEAVKMAATAIGIKTNDGVILAVEKKLPSRLMDPTSVEKIMEIDYHVGCASSGIAGDAKTLADHARVESQQHKFSYNEPLKVEAVTQSIADLAIHFGEGSEGRKDKPMSRPYGVSLLVAGVDEDGPQLYVSDPAGTYLKYKAWAIGSAAEGAQAYIKESYKDDMTMNEAEKLSLQVLKNVMEEKIDQHNVEVASVELSTGRFRIYTSDEVNTIIGTLS